MAAPFAAGSLSSCLSARTSANFCCDLLGGNVSGDVIPSQSLMLFSIRVSPIGKQHSSMSMQTPKKVDVRPLPLRGATASFDTYRYSPQAHRRSALAEKLTNFNLLVGGTVFGGQDSTLGP